MSEVAEFLRSERVTRTPLSDGTGVLLDVQGLAVYTLNETGMFLVEALSAGVEDVDALAAGLVEKFEVDATTARADTEKFIADLSKFLGK